MMPKRYWTHQRTMTDKEICDLYEELRSSVDVGIRAHISDTTVLKIVRAKASDNPTIGINKGGPA